MTGFVSDAAADRGGPRSRAFGRRRLQLLGGVVLGALAVAGNLAVYASVDRRTPVLQVVRDVPAGSLLTAEDLRVVDVGLDSTIRAVGAESIGRVVGQHAKVRMVAGALLVAEALQPEPLVDPSAAVVAIRLDDGSLPVGLRERSQVHLVIPADRHDPESVTEVLVGRLVGLPSLTSDVLGQVSVSVELDRHDAVLLAAADDVRVILVNPAEAGSTVAVES